MVFFDSTIDSFITFFENSNNKDVVIEFLNDVTQLNGNLKITDIKSFALNEETSFATNLRLECVHANEAQSIVKLQFIYSPKQIIDNQVSACLEIVDQNESKRPYKKFKPVIIIGIAPFTLFNNNACITHHTFMDTKTHSVELDLIQFHYIELPKFNKKFTEIHSMCDQLIWLLKHRHEYVMIPKELELSKCIKAFYEI